MTFLLRHSGEKLSKTLLVKDLQFNILTVKMILKIRRKKFKSQVGKL